MKATMRYTFTRVAKMNMTKNKNVLVKTWSSWNPHALLWECKLAQQRGNQLDVM